MNNDIQVCTSHSACVCAADTEHVGVCVQPTTLLDLLNIYGHLWAINISQHRISLNIRRPLFFRYHFGEKYFDIKIVSAESPLKKMDCD